MNVEMGTVATQFLSGRIFIPFLGIFVANFLFWFFAVNNVMNTVYHLYCMATLTLYTHIHYSQFRNNLCKDDSMHCYCYPGSSMRHPVSQWEERDGQGTTLTTTYSS
jgi:hypothetical protein